MERERGGGGMNVDRRRNFDFHSADWGQASFLPFFNPFSHVPI